jgi:hypothetical protein
LPPALSTCPQANIPILSRIYRIGRKKTLVMLGTVTYNYTGGNGQMASYAADR